MLVLLILLRLSKRLFGNHVQVEVRIKVDDSNLKDCGCPLLPEAVFTYDRPRLYRYHYLSRLPPQISRSIYSMQISPSFFVPSVNVCATVGCLPLPSCYSPSPTPLYSLNIYLRFIGYSTKG